MTARLIPTVAADYLRNRALSDGHDCAAIRRLETHHEQMRPVWAWLSKCGQGPALHYTVAALQAHSLLKGMQTLTPAQRLKHKKTNATTTGIPVLDSLGSALRSRKRGDKSDLLRFFFHHLFAFRFPLEDHGALTRVAATASVLLGEDVDPKFAAKVFNERSEFRLLARE